MNQPYPRIGGFRGQKLQFMTISSITRGLSPLPIYVLEDKQLRRIGGIISKHFLRPKFYLEPPPKPGIPGEPGTLERGRLPSGKVIKIRSFSCKPDRISVLSLTVKPVLIGTNSA